MQGYLHYIIELAIIIVGFLLKKEHFRIIQETKNNDKKISQITNELREFRNEVYKSYATRSELSEKLDKIERSLEKIHIYLLNKSL